MSDVWGLTTKQREEVLRLIRSSRYDDRHKENLRPGARPVSDENFVAWIDTAAVPAATGTAPDDLTVGELLNVQIYRYNADDGKLLKYEENGVEIVRTLRNYSTSDSPTETFVHVHRDNFGQFWGSSSPMRPDPESQSPNMG